MWGQIAALVVFGVGFLGAIIIVVAGFPKRFPRWGQIVTALFLLMIAIVIAAAILEWQIFFAA